MIYPLLEYHRLLIFVPRGVLNTNFFLTGSKGRDDSVQKVLWQWLC